ncbi:MULTISPECIES: DUF4252 domain-containing protein [Chitinophagaceae]
MKIILTLLFSVLTFSLFAQLPSDMIFRKYKNVKNISYTSANQTGKDSTTGKPIPMYMQSITVETTSPLYKNILADCEGIMKNQNYENVLSHQEDGDKTDVKKYDKRRIFEIIVFTRGEDRAFTLMSISAKNLTEAQKKQVYIQSN